MPAHTAAGVDVGVQQRPQILVLPVPRFPQQLQVVKSCVRGGNRSPDPVGARTRRLHLDPADEILLIANHGVERGRIARPETGSGLRLQVAGRERDGKRFPETIPCLADRSALVRDARANGSARNRASHKPRGRLLHHIEDLGGVAALCVVTHDVALSRRK